MFDSKKFDEIYNKFLGAPVVFVFYDRFTKKFGPLNVASNIDDVVYSASNLLKSVEDKNISLDHIDVYLLGYANVEKCQYDFWDEPELFFNGSDYKSAYNNILEAL